MKVAKRARVDKQKSEALHSFRVVNPVSRSYKAIILQIFCSKFFLYASIFVIVKLARSETYPRQKTRKTTICNTNLYKSGAPESGGGR
jgi:hypothetical protein